MVGDNQLEVVLKESPKITFNNRESIYSHENALEVATKYFKGDELAASTWVNKYALKDSGGNLYENSPDQMHHRMAKEIARIELKHSNPIGEKEIYNLLKDFKYLIPAGSPMAGIGNDHQITSLSNCFVIGEGGNSDSYGGIMKVDQEQVQLMKRRGGVGHDLSHIRPKGSNVKNSALTSTGIVPFMERYSRSTNEVAQDGRRGALMLSVSVKHPDVEDFIDAKMTPGKITGANVSVKIDDEFMYAVKNGEMYSQQYPIDSKNPKFTKKVDARKLWDKMMHNAHQSAEPGILFWDTVLRESIPDRYADFGYKTISTNPCGEIPLCPYDSCRLLALNLSSYVDEPFTPQATFNEKLFSKHAIYAQRIMDDIIDLETEKIDGIIKKIESDPEKEKIKSVELDLWKEIKAKTIEGRRTGIGITAEGDMLAYLGFQYGTEKATNFSTEVHKNLALSAYRGSVKLAKERGKFEIYNPELEKDNPLIQRIAEADPLLYQEMVEHGRRNIALLTIAPTGSVSICTQTSSGIEPAFMVSYNRRKKINPNDKGARVDETDDEGQTWQKYKVFHHGFEKWLEINGHNPEKIKEYDDEKLDEMIKKSPYYNATANEIDWVEKVKMQGSVQKWVDHSISVTVNLPKDTSKEIVSKIYETAWESGCKGMTIYRDGSRTGVLTSDKKVGGLEKIFPKKRPPVLKADVHRFINNNGTNEEWVAVVGTIEEKPYEIFLGKAKGLIIPKQIENGEVIKVKKGGDKSRYDFKFKDSGGYPVIMESLSRSFDKEFWNYAKLLSGILRNEGPVVDLVNTVKGLNLDSETINTWKNGVARVLSNYIPDGTKEEGGELCPECKDEDATWMHQGGCKICSCGHDACS